MKHIAIPMPAGRLPNRWRLSCAVIGHRAANSDSCECIAKTGLCNESAHTHIRHILSCFLGGHRFVRLVDRNLHHEYVCHGCGHQLLVSASHDPFTSQPGFLKRPRYWCSIFGHRVAAVAEREGMTEYACACGHSFLKPESGLKKIKHPLICTVAGHFVRFLVTRNGYSEYVCKWCGHTFCYRRPISGRVQK